jgi:hypothetical protein
MPNNIPPAERTWVKNTRLWIPWSVVEPAPGSFDWSAVDNTINAILADGCESILILLGGPIPGWARDDQYGDLSAYAPPRDLGDWYGYCAEMAERYGPVVDFYEIWNEPGWDRDSEVMQYGIYHFGGQVETDYLPLLQLGYAAIKEEDPTAAVICGALMYTLQDDPDEGTENYAMLFDDVNRPGQDVSIDIAAGLPITAVQSIDLEENGISTSVASSPQTEWHFGAARVGDSIQENIYLQNPQAEKTEVTLTFKMARGETFSRKVDLAGESELDLNINEFIGFHGSCDMVAVHPYKSPKFWGPFYANVVDTLRSQGATQEVVVSEAGWPSYSDKDPAAFSERYQADAIAELGVGGLFDRGCRKIWVYRDIDEDPGTVWDGSYYGMFKYTGEPHPAWSSYVQWQQQLPRYPLLPSSLP